MPVLEGTNWHEVAYIASPRSNKHGTIWNTGIIVYFFTCYLVLGVILCNLLTTLIVEFHKVVEEEEEPVRKEVVTQTVTEKEGAVEVGPTKHTLKAAARAVQLMERLKKDVGEDAEQIETVHELMVGKKQNWRSVVDCVTCL